MKRLIEILDVTGQASASSAGTVVFTLPQGFRYHSLSWVLVSVTGQIVLTQAPFTDRRLKIGGRVQRLATVDEANAMNALNNHPSATAGTAASTPYSAYNTANPGPAILQEFFSEPWREQYAAKERFALDVMKGDEPVTVEIDYISVTTAPTVALRAIVEPIESVQDDPSRSLNRVVVNGRNLPTLVKHFRTTRNAGGTSLDILDLPKQDLYQHIRIFHPTGTNITAVQIEKDGDIIFKRTKFENDGELRSLNMNPDPSTTAVTGFFDIVPDAQDAPRDAWNLSGADRFILRLTFAGTASVVCKIITHRFGIPE